MTSLLLALHILPCNLFFSIWACSARVREWKDLVGSPGLTPGIFSTSSCCLMVWYSLRVAGTDRKKFTCKEFTQIATQVSGCGFGQRVQSGLIYWVGFLWKSPSLKLFCGCIFLQLISGYQPFMICSQTFCVVLCSAFFRPLFEISFFPMCWIFLQLISSDVF